MAICKKWCELSDDFSTVINGLCRTFERMVEVERGIVQILSRVLRAFPRCSFTALKGSFAVLYSVLRAV
jgi:hypothetical protein